MRARPHLVPAAGAVALAGAALLAGCAARPSATPVVAAPVGTAPAAPAAVGTRSAPAAPLPPVDAAELDASRPADVAFWRSLQLEGAAILPPPSLSSLRGRSTVAVIARVVDVRASRVLHGTPVIAIVLRPRQVLSGRLQSAGDLRVETLSLGPQTTKAHLAQLRAALPSGLSLWFLRWQGAPPPVTKPDAPPLQLPTDPGLYALTHPFAVLAQGGRGVTAPLAERGAAPVGFLREVQPYRSLSALVRRLR